MKNSNIEWCDHTFNPWEGCTKVSPGCANCYAEARDKRFTGGIHWGTGAPRRRTSAANWNQVRKWNADTCKTFNRNPRPRVFCASLADWLDGEVPTQWRVDLLALIQQCPNLDFLLLTKRPGSWSARMHEAMGAGSELARSWLNGAAPANVWLGTTVEDQPRADQRIPDLIEIPARVRFLSCEPLLGPVNLCKGGAIWSDMNDQPIDGRGLTQHVHWVICGGESGPGARAFVVEYADDLRRQCGVAGGAFFMKQLGANPITTNANVLDWPEETDFVADLKDEFAAGASVALKSKKGGDIAEFPSELQVREFPEVRA